MAQLETIVGNKKGIWDTDTNSWVSNPETIDTRPEEIEIDITLFVLDNLDDSDDITKLSQHPLLDTLAKRGSFTVNRARLDRIASVINSIAISNESALILINALESIRSQLKE